MRSSAEMLAQCPSGRGKVEFDMSKQGLSNLFFEISGVNPHATHFDNPIFTPSSDVTAHPIWDNDDDRVQRSSNDLRSFHVRAKDAPEHTASITVKGGDMPFMKELLRIRGYAPVRRAQNGQIPGGCIQGAVQTEFNAALYLHSRFLETYRQLAPTALPLRMTTVTHVPASDGKLMDIRSYANSEEYVGTLSPHQRKELGLQDGEGLGDMLFDRRGVIPTEYVYALPEPTNVRVNDLYSYRLFGLHDDPRRGYDVEAYNLSNSDPLLHMNTDVDRMGDNFPQQPGRKDRVIRNVYGILASTYGFDAEDVLPKYEISDDNYLSTLSYITDRCVATGVDEHVLGRFINNMVRMVAVAHANERVFCRGDIAGGSLMPRNVTVGGAILDLDTLGKLAPEAHWRKIPRDIQEMTLSIASIERVVRTKNAPKLFDYVLNKYLAELSKLGVAKTNVHNIREYLLGEARVIDAATCLQNHTLDIFKKH